MVQVATSDGLVAELETLRDRLLRRLEEEGTLRVRAITDEAHRAERMSAHPQFWQGCAESWNWQSEFEAVCLDELTSALLKWLHDSQLWEQKHKEWVAMQAARKEDDVFRANISGILFAALAPLRRPVKEEGMPVFLHIYDITQEKGIQKLNNILANKNSWLKFGGAFHAGVEVNGLEWSFQFTHGPTLPGVTCVAPRSHTIHNYRETIPLKNTKLDPEDIAEIIMQLADEFPGSDYDLCQRNCCTFAEEFCQRLGVGGIPPWVHRLARLAAGMENMWFRTPQSFKDQFVFC